MPPVYPAEFRKRAVELARQRLKPHKELAAQLGISDSCLRDWVKQADKDEGHRSDGLTSADHDELVRLRRELKGREDGKRDPQTRCRLFRMRERPK